MSKRGPYSFRGRVKLKPEAPRTAYLTTLSNELVTIIIKNLDPPSAVCFALTCQIFQKLLDDLCDLRWPSYSSAIKDDDEEKWMNKFLASLPQYEVREDAAELWGKLERIRYTKVPAFASLISIINES